MITLVDTFSQAVQLLVSGDTALWTIIGVSFRVSLTALLISVVPATIIGFLLAYCQFPARWLVLSIVHTFMAVPTVVVGLILFMLLSRSGPLGDWRLLFTQDAMIIGQVLLCLPLLISMTHSAFQGADKKAWETAKMLGAHPLRCLWVLMHEIRFALMATLVAAFARIIAEVGCAMMVGGNILNYTRNITTAIALETLKGEYAQGVALGLVLFILAMMLNLGMALLRGKGQIGHR
ncbi:tungstate transport system permease protein [Oceanospirillum multiglobuliferum]|uniref:ABC transporter permease n=1 Tax=Oceanospirillum multiglobuliferum TaxID=64969 RepID=UPI0009D12B1C|nr:ABC transporter permease [Oceanospirillum multiglobuliferum]SKA11290.1 tungstate transport system permease protein [Oceanospirillum multiglobuliferum]